MRCVVWNVRGAVKKGFANLIKSLTSLHDIKIMAILEPRISGARAISVANSLGFSQFHIESAVGFSGGIWLLWKHDDVRVHILHSTSQVVTALIHSGLKIWILSVVYGNPQPIAQRYLWDFLSSVHHRIDLPWLVAGDFNEITSSSEKCGGSVGYVKTGFKECVNSESLIDLGYSGSPFTWVKNPNMVRPLNLRLDIALVNQN